MTNGSDVRMEKAEKKNTIRALFSFLLLSARTNAAEQADDRREGIRRKARLDDEHRAAERRENGKILPDVRALLEQHEREQDGEERRHLVEDVRIREDQMVDGVIVAEDAERAAGRAQDEGCPSPT